MENYTKIKFRELNADELELRAARVLQKGVQLLIYKTARVDMDVLDETVGAENWQDRFDEHKGILFCQIGIRCDDEWIWKGDAGTESNTEAEKGNASDARKRAGFVWGIGRALYSAPFIWIPSDKCKIETNAKTGKPECKDRFVVTDIKYASGKITSLNIAKRDKSGDTAVFSFARQSTAGGKKTPQTKKTAVNKNDTPSAPSTDDMKTKINGLLKAISAKTGDKVGAIYKMALAELAIAEPNGEAELTRVVNWLAGYESTCGGGLKDDDIPSMIA